MKWKTKLSNKIYQHVFHAIDIPDDLAGITSIDDKGEQTAADVGLAPETVEQIWAATQALFKTGMHPALGICLRRHGKIVLNRSLGLPSMIWLIVNGQWNWCAQPRLPTVAVVMWPTTRLPVAS
jgi:hypothetical protein